jgi:hypothetical protein
MLSEHDDIGCKKLAALVEAQLRIIVSEMTLQRIAKEEGLQWIKRTNASSLSTLTTRRSAWPGPRHYRNDDFSDWMFAADKILRWGGTHLSPLQAW